MADGRHVENRKNKYISKTVGPILAEFDVLMVLYAEIIKM